MTAASALRAPRWTKARLSRVLAVKYGYGPRGGLNLTAAANDLGVSSRSLYRWLQVPDGRHRAKIPAPRLELLITQLLPSQETLDDEVYQLENFRRAVTGWQARPRRLNPAWKEQLWLQPHQVSILALADMRLRQVAITRVKAKNHQVLYRRGQVIDSLVLPTKMHAHAVTYQLLRTYHSWRVHAPTDTVRVGPTWCWFADAPPTDLQSTAFDYTPTGDPAELVKEWRTGA